MTTSQDKLKIVKYRCQTLGMKELDVIFSKVLQKILIDSDESLIDELFELLNEETQYIYSLIFNPPDLNKIEKYKKIFTFIKTL